MWYRSSPAELYYKRLEGRPGVQQSKRLEVIIETFTKELIERGRQARPEVDEMPPLLSKSKLCGHKRKCVFSVLTVGQLALRLRAFGYILVKFFWLRFVTKRVRVSRTGG